MARRHCVYLVEVSEDDAQISRRISVTPIGAARLVGEEFLDWDGDPDEEDQLVTEAASQIRGFDGTGDALCFEHEWEFETESSMTRVIRIFVLELED